MKHKSSLITVAPDKKIQLRDIDADATGEFSVKEDALPYVEKLRARLGELQEILYAEHRRSLLIVLQAMDTGGKDGAIKSLMTGVDPVGVRVASFKSPSVEELDHDFLWRVHKQTPPKGTIGVWNRSHYEDVLITRVHKMIDKKTYRARYGDINAFEQLMCNSGITTLKFYLHISKDEQKERLQARLDDPAKHWKFNPADVKERELWDDYQDAYQDAINATSTKLAPWYIVPANKKWARNIALAEAVVEALEAMNPQFPTVDFEPKSIVIR